MNIFEFILMCLQWVFKLLLCIFLIECFIITVVLVAWVINTTVEYLTGFNIFKWLTHGK